MSLINEQQKKNAGDEGKAPVKIPVPKPNKTEAPAQPEPIAFDGQKPPLVPIEGADIQEFEQPLREAQAAEANSFNISDAIRPGASSEPIKPVAAPEPVTPYTPGVELWQDVTFGADAFKIDATVYGR